MSLALSAQNRTVLLMSDEALYVYTVTARGVKLIETAQWDSPNFDEAVVGAVRRDGGGNSVIFLNDMLEQHYRKEKILKRGVSSFDRSGMIHRKLAIAFPNHAIRGSYPLKEKAPKTEKLGASEIHIFAALPETSQLQKAVGAVEKSLASVGGLCLLPVESSDMVSTLYKKIIGKNATKKAQWVVFIGQHRSGGLRQIVVKNGDLALTRMTPISEDDSGNPQLWAEEALQEFNATMSYVSRFGFQPEDGLHVIALANPDPGDTFQNLINGEFATSIMTNGEAAQLLGIPLGSQMDGRYADVLHAAWAGRESKFLLPMNVGRIDRVSRPRQTAMAASVMLFAALMFLTYQFVINFSTVSRMNTEIQENQSALNQLNVKYQQEVQKKEALGFDVKLVQSTIAVKDALDKASMDILPILSSVGVALGNDMRIDKITVEKPESSGIVDLMPDGQPKKPPQYIATMQLTYPGNANIDKGNQEIRDLASRLQSLLKNAKVNIVKLLKDYEYSAGLVVETGDLAKRNVNQDYIAEIRITGAPQP